MFKFLQKGVTDPSKRYVAKPKDSSLQSILHEAFKVLEHRFANFDHDQAETLMYKELERELAMGGFKDGDKLASIFKRVDFDGDCTSPLSPEMHPLPRKNRGPPRRGANLP
jgi:hypothetical protein